MIFIEILLKCFNIVLFNLCCNLYVFIGKFLLVCLILILNVLFFLNCCVNLIVVVFIVFIVFFIFNIGLIDLILKIFDNWYVILFIFVWFLSLIYIWSCLFLMINLLSFFNDLFILFFNWFINFFLFEFFNVNFLYLISKWSYFIILVIF